MPYKDRNRKLAYYREYNKQSRVKAQVSAHHRESRQKRKMEVLFHYSVFSGKPMCAIPGCLISDPDMLCIDHVNGGGRKHRESLGWMGCGNSIYAWLKKHKYPPGFQVLCFNHNAKKEMERYKEPLIGKEDP